MKFKIDEHRDGPTGDIMVETYTDGTYFYGTKMMSFM